MTKHNWVVSSTIIALCTLPPSIGATSVEPKELSALVADADHIIAGTVVLVDMVDAEGTQLTNPDDGTGPGEEKTIRLHIVVSEVIKSDDEEVPGRLVVALWSMWHYNLSDVREWHEGTPNYIFLLAGPNFQRVYPALFIRAVSERDAIDDLLRDGKAPEDND